MLMERRCKRVPSYRKTENRLYHAFKQYQTIALLRHKSQRNKSQRHQSLSQPCQEFLKLSYGKRVTFCISRKGSLTVEAALVLPLFFFAVLTLLNLMEVCRLQGMVNMSLQESAETLGTYGYVLAGEEEGAEMVLGTGACMMYAQSQMPEEVREHGSISLLRSRYEDHTVKLQADYKMKIGYLFFRPEVKVTCRASVRAWEGDTDQERQAGNYEEMVFVTEHGQVYHISSACRHLSVKISAGSKGKISSMRNESGERYHACEKCVGGGAVNDLLYVTSSGNRYHNSSECSGLKRSVRLVKHSEVAGYPVCSTCQSMEKKGVGE